MRNLLQLEYLRSGVVGSSTMFGRNLEDNVGLLSQCSGSVAPYGGTTMHPKNQNHQVNFL